MTIDPDRFLVLVIAVIAVFVGLHIVAVHLLAVERRVEDLEASEESRKEHRQRGLANV